jgi:hypothetical protein
LEYVPFLKYGMVEIDEEFAAVVVLVAIRVDGVAIIP